MDRGNLLRGREYVRRERGEGDEKVIGRGE